MCLRSFDTAASIFSDLFDKTCGGATKDDAKMRVNTSNIELNSFFMNP